MDESHKTLIDIQARNVADANRVGRIIYDRDEVRRSLIAGEHPAQVWQPTQRRKQPEDARRAKAINIRMRDADRSFSGLIPLPADQSHDSDEIADVIELAELRALAVDIADEARLRDSPDFDLADAALDAIEDLDLTLMETLTTLATSTAAVTASG